MPWRDILELILISITHERVILLLLRVEFVLLVLGYLLLLLERKLVLDYLSWLPLLLRIYLILKLGSGGSSFELEIMFLLLLLLVIELGKLLTLWALIFYKVVGYRLSLNLLILLDKLLL